MLKIVFSLFILVFSIQSHSSTLVEDRCGVNSIKAVLSTPMFSTNESLQSAVLISLLRKDTYKSINSNSECNSSCSSQLQFSCLLNTCKAVCDIKFKEVSCPDDQVKISGVCEPKVISCEVENGTGLKTWNTGLSDYGACSVSSCYPLFHQEENSCLPNTKNCEVENGNGYATWDQSKLSYSQCMVSSCYTRFHQEENSCLSDTRSCPINNGFGEQTWSSSNGYFGDCLITQCISGYEAFNGECVNSCKLREWPCTEIRTVDGADKIYYQIYNIPQIRILLQRTTSGHLMLQARNLAIKEDLDFSAYGEDYLLHILRLAHIDGDGHTFSNKKGKPLILEIFDGALVSNLKFKDFNLYVTDGSTTGLGVVTSNLTRDSKIKNIEVRDSTFSNPTSANLGSVAGSMQGSIEQVIVENSKITGIAGGILVGKIFSGSTVKDVKIRSSEAITTNPTKGEGTGGLAGSIQLNTLVEDVTVSGVVLSSSALIGGIAGFNNGDIKNSFVIGATISANSFSSFAGGFVGEHRGNGTISNSFVSESTVYSTGDYVAGFAGKSYGKLITTSGVKTTSVSGRAYVGGFIGLLNQAGTISYCSVTDVSASGQSQSTTGAFFGKKEGTIIDPL